jgi:hypothetical protein
MHKKISMMFLFGAVAMMALMTLGEGNAYAGKNKESSQDQEPVIKIPPEELKNESDEGDGELKRLGNFGKLHFFGYGELHYNGFIGPTGNEIDFHRWFSALVMISQIG